MDGSPYAGIVTDEEAEQNPPEHIVAQNRLQRAFLIRCIHEGVGGYFILEDVISRKRTRFDSVEALLARLELLLITS